MASNPPEMAFLLDGIALFMHREKDSLVGTNPDDMDIYDKRLGEVIEAANRFAQLRNVDRPVSQELQPYIEMTSDFALPTDEQVGAFAENLEAYLLEGAFKRQYFMGFHFYLDPGAGQEDKVLDGALCVPFSTRENMISRAEYIERFGYLGFDHIFEHDLSLTEPLAFEQDRPWGTDDIGMIDPSVEDETLFYPVPPEVLSLATLVNYNPREDGARIEAFVKQIGRLRKLVEKGRKEYL